MTNKLPEIGAIYNCLDMEEESVDAVDMEEFVREQCRIENPYALDDTSICVKGFGRDWKDYYYFRKFREKVGWKDDQDQQFRNQSKETQAAICELLKHSIKEEPVKKTEESLLKSIWDNTGEIEELLALIHHQSFSPALITYLEFILNQQEQNTKDIAEMKLKMERLII